MKKLVLIFFFFIKIFSADARHIAGGEMYYEWIGGDGSSNTYKITLRLFRDCNSNGPLLENEQVTTGIYQNAALFMVLPLPLIGPITTITLNPSTIPCLIGSVNVCYEIGIYSATVNLPINSSGYILSRLGCCRIDNISNLTQNSVGSNYVSFIPGTNDLPVGHNSSPQYLVKDATLVCAHNHFTLDFSAIDADGDSLSYSFCNAYTSLAGSNNQPPPPTIDLSPVPYGNGYSGNTPLGPGVTINPATGIISGIAPDAGQYVVNVCIKEWRNGKPFSEHRKDFNLKVQSCDIVQAILPDQIINCKNFTVYFENQSTSSAITSYLWEFGDPLHPTANSTNPTVQYTYADTGRFKAKLTVTAPGGCVGTATTTVLVYPGFTPDFNIQGSCFQNPYHFFDATKTKYGIVNSWRWNFGDSDPSDTSLIQNPSYTYNSSGNRIISLIVASSKGCIDTVNKPITILDKPIIQLPFRDTLICSSDTLGLIANSAGSFSWLPNYNIIAQNSANPFVFPQDTTTYFVTVNNAGCINSDSIKVNVLKYITVDAGVDSVICKSDSFRLHPISYALGYQWKASSGIFVDNIKYPLVAPLINTEYYVTANLGKCVAKDSVNIKVVPYPQVFAGPDTTICFGNRALLKGTIKGSFFRWSPINSLLNSNSLSPIAGPDKSTLYVLTVGDTLGCAKERSDSVLVTVIPNIHLFAGNDTSISANQPLILNATVSNSSELSGISYAWTPTTGLSDPSIANPIASFPDAVDSITYSVRVTVTQGCYAVDQVHVRIFKGSPEIFVPSAFTPNDDKKNDVLRPIPIGIVKLLFFKVYNRWGQMVFSTNEIGKGWDGIFNGNRQSSGTYVYLTEGIDFKGFTIFRKGTSVLIR